MMNPRSRYQRAGIRSSLLTLRCVALRKLLRGTAWVGRALLSSGDVGEGMREELSLHWLRQSVAYRGVMVLFVALGILSGCDSRAANDYASPEAAALAMFSSFARVQSDPERAWAFLGPDTRARLEILAAQGPERFQPIDYLRFGWVPDEALVLSMKRLDSGGRTARLAIETELGDRFELELIREDRGWQIELGTAEPFGLERPDEGGTVQPKEPAAVDLPSNVDPQETL